ncbi:MAG: hypothetical protein SFZ23_01860 [Planctomycetota bacterium]|nr:hypothetical protein [Planctomycetota bacterium]
MGLDLYAGTFTRYYLGDWQTVVQQSFPGQVTVQRPPNPDRISDPIQISEIVAQWMKALSTGTGLTLDWDESLRRPYFTDKPAWDAFGALKIWAAHDDQSLDASAHDQPITIENWSKDPSLTPYRDQPGSGRYPYITSDTEIWLPLSEPALFTGPDATGNERMFGEVGMLLAELELLNQRTWNASDEAAEQWRRDGVEHASPLEPAARFGWAVTRCVAAHAVKHRLPLLLDY